jgi:hypothetical protein
MAGATVQPSAYRLGDIRVQPAEPLCVRRDASAAFVKFPRFQYTWHPPETLQEQLPQGFTLSLQCVLDSTGLRRFYPWNGLETFLTLASSGGLAILCRQQSLGPNARHSYRAMRWLFLRTHRITEHFRHRFDSSRDLTIALSGRSERQEKDVLPADLGMDAHGQGHRWSVTELIARGKTAASAAGCPRPTMAQCIHHGLIEAARRNPLRIAQDKVPELIRSTLFNVASQDAPCPELVEMVTERLLTALQRHLDKDTGPFEKWFLGSNNSLVHQLAKQKRSTGGALEEEDVRRVLLHLGWQSYEFASNCLHAQMRIFHNALPDPLTDRERLLFEHLHLRQPYLGNFPLLLLAPRLGFIKGLLWDLWEMLPNRSLVPVVHRLFDYYATMAARRREADRRIKQPRPARLVEEIHVPSRSSQRFQELAAALRELKKIDCGCPRRDWWAELKGRPGTKIRIMHRCMACDFQKETILTREEFKELGPSLL